MALQAACPRCSLALPVEDDSWNCVEHGPVLPLWRPGSASYESFGEHLALARSFPTYLPWPLEPGWQVTDFAALGRPGQVRASVTAVTGVTSLDGAVDVLVVTEEPGSGLGARVAGTRQSDPGTDIAGRPSELRVRVGSAVVPLWTVSTHDSDSSVDRSVVAGEAGGRWLWLVLRPASAILLLAESWILADVSGLGAVMLETPFGGQRPAW